RRSLLRREAHLAVRRETSERGASSQCRGGSAGSIPGFPAAYLPIGVRKPQHPAAPFAAGRHRGAEVKTQNPGAGPAPCALGLRLDGWSVNHKRVQRIWREEGLQSAPQPDCRRTEHRVLVCRHNQ
ncbi:IS3 family transposase, partial [Synechococcus sp. CS-1330]|nr:IS3 family transposase [Synechococcus sp. CS-1330]